MLLRFSWLKMIRANRSTITSSGVTSYTQVDNALILPIGSTGAATAAPSTLVVDQETKIQYYLNNPFSATHAALTAVTSTNDSVNLF